MKKTLIATSLLALTALSGCQQQDAAIADPQKEQVSTTAQADGSTSTQTSATPNDKGANMSKSKNANFSKPGQLNVGLDDIAIEVNASSCTSMTDTNQHCEGDVKLTIKKADGTLDQTIALDSLYINTEATLYRYGGPIDDSDKYNGHSINLGDVNNDGLEDLIIQTGREGSYGGPSYSVYLFDSTKKQFVYNEALSDLTVGVNGLFKIKDGKIVTIATSGCCEFTTETYELENNTPRLVERIVEDTTEDKDNPKITKEVLVNGKMQKQ